jgi:hypothetical protein
MRSWSWASAPVLAVVGALAVGSAAAGAAECPNAGLRVGVAAQLPDCRGYELVSPTDKNGADVAGVPQRTRVASDGGAVTFASLSGFADAAGSGNSFDYMAVRDGRAGTQGWATHAITPGNLEPPPFLTQIVAAGFDSTYAGEFSADLSSGIFRTLTPLTAGSPDTDKVAKIFRRTNLRSPGGSPPQLVSDCPACVAPLSALPSEQPEYAGASADFSHVIFESTMNLTADAAALDLTQPKLYEWTNGTVRLAGILSDGTPAASSQAGQGVLVSSAVATAPSHYAPNSISRDGSRIFFTVRGVDAASGDIYMRSGNSTATPSTVQLNVAEPTPDASQPHDARFWGATPDGSKALFSTGENLTGASDPSTSNLYIYDVNAPAGSHLTRVSTPDPGMTASVEGVLGMSDDAHYVYFVSGQQLLAGGPTTSGADRIFVWHDGVIHEIGTVPHDDLFFVAMTGSWLQQPWLARVSPDGTHLVFRSKNALTGNSDDLPHSGVGDACTGAAGGCEEIYVYDATGNGGAGALACASCHQPDGPSQSDATFIPTAGRGAAAFTSHLNHPLSADGRHVFFSTDDRLVQADQDGTASDVYDYDTVTGELHLLSSGRADSSGSYFMDATPDGSNVFFVTRDRLVGWDTDSQMDMYDARVDGGFSDPVALPAPCAGDACHGPQGAPLGFAAPASTTIAGGGNVKHKAVKRKPVKRKVKCAKGRVRKRVHGKVRCVKRPAHRTAKKAATRGRGR